MDTECACEGLDGGEEALLEGRRDERRGGLRRAPLAGEAVGSSLHVLRKKLGEAEFRCVGRKAVDLDRDDDSVGERAADAAQVALEAPHHDGFEELLALDGDAATE